MIALGRWHTNMSSNILHGVLKSADLQELVRLEIRSVRAALQRLRNNLPNASHRVPELKVSCLTLRHDKIPVSQITRFIEFH